MLELKQDVWNPSFQQLPLNSTPGITQCSNSVLQETEPDSYLLFLVVEHREIEVDKFKIAGRRRIVSSFEFAVESFGHLAHARVNLHTHLRYLRLHSRQHIQAYDTIRYDTVDLRALKS